MLILIQRKEKKQRILPVSTSSISNVKNEDDKDDWEKFEKNSCEDERKDENSEYYSQIVNTFQLFQ